jgi:eukaryotic-like serine/threonine-protein kinase
VSAGEAGRDRLRRLRPGRRGLRIALAVAVPGFLLGYVLTALVFFGGGPRADVVTVPDLRSLTEPRARRLAERAALVLEITDSLPNAGVPRGGVVVQSPLPGREVAPETPVRVILSQGRERRAVPRVDGYPRRQAERILVASGFRVVVHAVPDMRRPGRVVGTLPAAGGTVQMPGTVRLLVSAGPPLLAVPDLVGMLQGDAGVALQQVGLSVGEVTMELRPELPEGAVLAQAPAGGDSVRAGSAVDLWVASRQLPLELDEGGGALEEPPSPEPEEIEL